MKGSAVKLIPYKAHAALDLTSEVLALAVPLGFRIQKEQEGKTLLAMGVTGLVVRALSLVGASKK